MTTVWSLVPEGVTPLAACLLILSSFVTSAITAAFGLGGGVILLAIMANLMPAAAIVPVHGAVQLGSNAGRAAVLLRHIDWGLFAWFCAGSVLGAFAGGQIAITLSIPVLQAGIALFLLWTVWGSLPRLRTPPRPVIGIAGFAATLLGMFFGATGPIGGAVLATLKLARQTFVATQAATALSTHILKVLVFGALGFSFAPWGGLVAAMLASGFAGTLTGSRLLNGMKEEKFRKAFSLIITALAVILLWRAAADYFMVP